ncbi:hypothetical protein [Iningainema tapete]|uniref:Uncharacterized protein n=1 Tax=Iningainema tapete BLCC-T55 TaxID=2748662 RepID=A0A8J6XIM7_9CYAN|nr:hypothetical protein [Iningainema tapete]MBD2771411.1 hypothetical protein [Iningainema tapete BLCC-T55]
MLRLLPIAIRKILQQIQQRQKVEQTLPEAQAQLFAYCLSQIAHTPKN